ncbi:MAG: membrane protein insertase YidC, partial [Candidatus Omnitrophota bacterium]
FSMRSPLLMELDTQKFSRNEGESFLEYTMVEEGFLSITKKYVFRNSLDYIGLSVVVKNLSSHDILFSYQITGPSGLKKADSVAGRNFLEANALINGKTWKTKVGKKTIEKNGMISWVALKNRYFSLILQSFDPAKSLIVQSEGTEKLVTRLNSGSYRIVPSETVTSEYCFYAGPLDDKKLAVLGNEDMSGIVDYGFFGPVSKVLLAILNFFYNVMHNWGVAIICLTVLINVILFPLTYKSFSSMQKMKKIQPHMAKLKELHKDNPHKLNKETMELYKKYNVNPLGGCLPMLLQMPIFIALYQGLMRSIELKGSHFLWVKNLARPDAVPLPFSLPVIGSSVNILPLLMVGMMVIQQKISQGTMEGTTPEQAKQQKMMMMFMPIIFGFLFYQMPSGLVLYWLTNTVLMTAEQTFIVKRTGE